MQTVTTIAETRKILSDIRRGGSTIGLVPTMGALHEGHLSLVRAACTECGFVAVSIFVNPTQFGPGEDFSSYPRPIEHDLDLCRSAGLGLVFNPAPEEMYPSGPPLTTVQVGGLTDSLCGRLRPGHFAGVTTVVTKLLNIVQPDAAYFGQKDVQQALVIRRMAADLDVPIRIRICPTVRDEGGLALSSRNQYLSESERVQARCLYRSLRTAAELIRGGQRGAKAIVDGMTKVIEAAGPSQVQYIAVVDLETLREVEAVDKPVVIALAVRIGSARLIDNIIVDGRGDEIQL